MPLADSVSRAARRLMAGRPRVVLAVSGGLDSMALLHAVSRAASSERIVVATFDHGTGAAARRAVRLVAEEGARLGVRVHVGRASLRQAGEAAWRRARWDFLRRVSIEESAPVATAHTADDQLETVVMRALRGSGARGLAGLYADSAVLRPLLGVRRTRLEAWARRAGVRHVEDPSNASMRHLRNRVRRDLIPAIHGVDRAFGDQMLALARRAAQLRGSTDGLAEQFIVRLDSGALCVARQQLATYDSEALAMLWPAIAARFGVTLDRRGTVRLAQFTIEGTPGSRVQLSGRAEVVRCRDGFIFDRGGHQTPDGPLPLDGSLEFGPWRFERVDVTASHGDWVAALPANATLAVRRWRAGDRMWSAGLGAARRVKRFFSEAHVMAPERNGWPVVTADGEIVWIPGIRRSDAATVRPGWPVVHYACERIRG